MDCPTEAFFLLILLGNIIVIIILSNFIKINEIGLERQILYASLQNLTPPKDCNGSDHNDDNNINDDSVAIAMAAIAIIIMVAMGGVLRTDVATDLCCCAVSLYICGIAILRLEIKNGEKFNLIIC